MMREDIKKIIEKHVEWLKGNEEGVRADLSHLCLNGADLRYVNLRYANLSNANLSNANLYGANLRGANLYGTNLRNADLRGADLYGANLRGAILNNVEYNENTAMYALACPEKGSFIGYKKVRNYIIELQITEDAKRSSATSRKCRCSKAKVLSITNLDGIGTELKQISSSYRDSFVYKLGETVEEPDFCEDRWNECAPGIHFFITRDEAVRY